MLDDLRRVFAGRLQSVVVYGLDQRDPDGLLHTLALVERLTFEDLAACAPLSRGWRKQGLDAPLILEVEEFRRTLDVFPLEYGEIIDRHVLVAGRDPFAGATVTPADVRRAVEMHAKSLLIHLREGFLESGGEARAVGRLIAASAPSLHALLVNIARLEGAEAMSDVAAAAERQVGVPAGTIQEVFSAGAGAASAIADPTALLARYIAAAEQIWEYVDRWH